VTRRTWFFLGITGAVGCRRDERPRLNVWNWSSYVGPETIPAFEREFGVRVRYATYESNEEMLAKVMSGNSGWDVVFPTSYLIQPMREMGLLSPLRHSLLAGLRHLEPAFQRPAWDPELRWGVPYMWNATGICHSTDWDIESWADLWESELQGRITMLDDPVDVFGACLKKLHRSVNTRVADDLRAAQSEALEQKELVRAYVNAEVRDQLVAGDVLAAQLWSTTAQQAIDASAKLAFTYPSEGFPVYPDVAVVLRESRRVELAHRFLEYLLRPEVAAGIVQGARTATANGTARALLPEDLRTNQTLYPPAETMALGEWVLASPPEIQRLRDRLWTEIKAA
jgi:spermidine/putrescine transport system substrate-binding protein